MSITRMATASTYERTINNISKQQAELTQQMEHASAGKRVIRASDDPVAAAQAERARTRLTRIETDQRTLDAQAATMKYAESTLGSISDALQEFRELMVQAGNGSYDAQQREAIAQQLRSLKEQIVGYANRRDSNGLPLFRGLDATATLPFSEGGSNIRSGQVNGGEFSITNSLNGAYAFSSVSTGNGVLAMAASAGNQSSVAPTDTGTIIDPSKATALVPPEQVVIRFAVDADGVATYTVEGGADHGMSGTYQAGAKLQVQGLEFAISGTPADGDSLVMVPSEQQSLFETLNMAIASISRPDGSEGPLGNVALSYAISRTVTELDTAMDRVSSVRGVAGDQLNQAERITSTLLARSELMEETRSTAEDLDLVEALSKLKTQETVVSAALQSYTSIQKLSLFNYIS